MASLTALPDELLVEIGKHLDAADLCALSLTARKFRPVAQELLLRNPYERPYMFFVPPSAPSNQISLLLRTLLDRPELASAVKILQLTVARGQVPLAFDYSITTIWGHQFPTANLFPRQRLDIYEPQVAAILLTLLPKLEELRLEIIPEDRGWEESHRWGEIMNEDGLEPEALFSDQTVVELSSVAGFAKLKRLEMLSHQFTKEFIVLPCLQHLSLVDVRGDFNEKKLTEAWPTCNISSLELTVNPMDDNDYARMFSLLQSFVQLSEFKLELHSTRWHPLQFNFVSLIQHMGAFYDTLEILDLSGANPEYPADFPIKRLTMFKQLSVLRIPQLAIYAFGNETIPCPVELFLPESLGTLDLHEANLFFLEWFQKALNTENYLCSPKQLIMHLTGNISGTFDIVESEVNINACRKLYREMATSLKTAGINVNIWSPNIEGELTQQWVKEPGWQQETSEESGLTRDADPSAVSDQESDM